MPSDKHTGFRATTDEIFRIIAPTSTSVFTCICIAIVLFFLDLISISVNYGMIFPNIFYGEWATIYTNDVIQPTLRLTNNYLFNHFVEIITWVLTGLLFYFVIQGMTSIVTEWHSDSNQKSFSLSEKSVHRILRRDLILRTAWQSSLLGLSLWFLFLLQPVFSHSFLLDEQIAENRLATASIKPSLEVLLIWFAIFYGIAIVSRLYTVGKKL